MMNPAVISRAISSQMVFLFSSEKRRKGCFTGFAPGRTWRECSHSSFGTPKRSLCDQAKMSKFSRRNWMSALSYLSERPAPMVTVRSGCAGSTWIFFVSSVGLNVGADWKLPIAGIPSVADCAVYHDLLFFFCFFLGETPLSNQDRKSVV